MYIITNTGDVIPAAGCVLVQDTELSTIDAIMMGQGQIIPDEVLEKATPLGAIIDHYMGIQKRLIFETPWLSQ